MAFSGFASDNTYPPTLATIIEEDEDLSPLENPFLDYFNGEEEEEVEEEDAGEMQTLYRQQVFSGTSSYLDELCDKQQSDESELVTRPVRLDNLPTTILKKILWYILPVGETVTPWFKAATYIRGPRGWGTDRDLSFIPNIDASFLLVNKACHKIGTEIIYGSNHFRLCYLKRTDCAVWWLRRIGDDNIRKIKMMSFYMNSGWAADSRDSKIRALTSENCHEEDWLHALTIVQNRDVKFDYLHIVTWEWDDLKEDELYKKEDKDELNFYRKLSIDILMRFRDVKKAKIEQIGEQWVGADSSKVELIMQQPGWTLHQEPPTPKMTFWEAAEKSRVDRIALEKRIEEELNVRINARFDSSE